MFTKDIMGRVKAARKTAKVRDIAMRLLSGEHSSLPVVDDDGAVVGIISEFDILRAIRGGKSVDEITVDEIMSRNPVCVEEDIAVDKLIDIMTEKHLIRVPVTRNGKLAGSISRTNILDSIVNFEFKESFWILRD